MSEPIDTSIVERKTLTRERHTFVPVLFGDGKKVLHKMSHREAKFCAKFLATMSLDSACLEIGLERAAGERYFKRRNIKRYLNDKLEERALAQGLTVDKLLSKLSLHIDGEMMLTESQMDGVKTAAKILRPAGSSAPNLTQVNVNVSVGASPYEKLSESDLQDQLKDAADKGAS